MSEGYRWYTRHARRRMDGRRINHRAVDSVCGLGRRVYTRGAVIYVVGRREVKIWERRGIDLSSLEGVHVVCEPGGRIKTVYRNRRLDRLRPRHGGRHIHFSVKFRLRPKRD